MENSETWTSWMLWTTSLLLILPAVQKLDLSLNMLKSFSCEEVGGSSTLRYLNLLVNNIQEFSWGFFLCLWTNLCKIIGICMCSSCNATKTKKGNISCTLFKFCVNLIWNRLTWKGSKLSEPNSSFVECNPWKWLLFRMQILEMWLSCHWVRGTHSG